MTHLPVSKAREGLAEALNRVAYSGERIVLERRGKRIAAIVSVEDLDLLERLEDDLDVALARERLADAEKRGTVPWEKVRARLRPK